VVLALAGRSLPHELVVIADPALMADRAGMLGLPLSIHEFDGTVRAGSQTLTVLPVAMASAVTPGKPDSANAGYVLETLRRAVRGCLDGEFAAMVTGPVHKAVLNQAGHRFTGHTEFIAAQCGETVPVMMLANRSLRVALVTTHLPLKEVCDAVTADRLKHVITVVHHDLISRFGIHAPRLLVCGLNPHAGEQGYLGREETEIIEPALGELRAAGLDLIGPVPADTAFTPNALQGMDAVVAMYHDQGLPPLKAQGFGETVNITLGLPLIRTSVDHGTALELAGTGKARPDSLLAATDFAYRLALRAAA
jgi:4-hydroxythreonine-4-phosphate dehydrogenase